MKLFAWILNSEMCGYTDKLDLKDNLEPKKSELLIIIICHKWATYVMTDVCVTCQCERSRMTWAEIGKSKAHEAEQNMGSN